MSLQQAIQDAQALRSLVSTTEMLELQVHQLPVDVAQKAELKAQVDALNALVGTVYLQAQAAVADARAAQKPAG